MNLKKKYLEEINAQEQNNGTEILKWFLSIAKSSSQWNSFVLVKWVNNKREWYPTLELRLLSKGYINE